MNKSFTLLLTLTLLMVSMTACSQKSGETLVTVNGEKITSGDLDLLTEINPRTRMQIQNPMGLKQVVGNLIDQELLYQASLKKDLDDDPLVKSKIELYRKVIIAQSYLENEVDAAAKAYYDNHPQEFEKLGLSHILVAFQEEKGGKTKGARSEKEALEEASKLKEKIENGEKFEDVAKTLSDDPGSKARGGNLGLLSRDDPRLMRRGYGPLLEKAFTMKVGEVAGPIKTKEGFHLISLSKGLEAQTFDEVKIQLTYKLRDDIRKETLDTLRKDGKITFADGSSATEPAPTPDAQPTPATEGDHDHEGHDHADH